MKNAERNYSRNVFVLVLLLTAMLWGAASGEMVFKYRSSAVGDIQKGSDETVSPECDNPDNVGTIGNSPGCEGMLIVDDGMLRSAASAEVIGDETFRISHDTGTYTFADSEKNIFTGQVRNMSGIFMKTDFNGDIGYWDTSDVTTMSYVVAYNESFDQAIGQ